MQCAGSLDASSSKDVEEFIDEAHDAGWILDLARDGQRKEKKRSF